MNFRFGADPEVFVRRRDTREIVSAFNMVPGTKETPHKVKGGAIQVDGMALEFNLTPCYEMGNTFYNRLLTVMAELEARIGPEYELAIVASNEFRANYIRNQPLNARRLGCEPDFNAYTMEVNNPPDSKTLRTAAGHIHIGWWKQPIKDKNRANVMAAQAALQMDSVVGLILTLLDRSRDSKKRQYMYGKAGAYRPRPYGTEYRVPSNIWIQNRQFYDIIANATMAATNLLATGHFIPEMDSNDKCSTQCAIDWQDDKLAYRILDQRITNFNIMSNRDLGFIRELGEEQARM